MVGNSQSAGPRAYRESAFAATLRYSQGTGHPLPRRTHARPGLGRTQRRARLPALSPCPRPAHRCWPFHAVQSIHPSIHRAHGSLPPIGCSDLRRGRSPCIKFRAEPVFLHTPTQPWKITHIVSNHGDSPKDSDFGARRRMSAGNSRRLGRPIECHNRRLAVEFRRVPGGPRPSPAGGLAGSARERPRRCGLSRVCQCSAWGVLATSKCRVHFIRTWYPMEISNFSWGIIIVNLKVSDFVLGNGSESLMVHPYTHTLTSIRPSEAEPWKRRCSDADRVKSRDKEVALALAWKLEIWPRDKETVSFGRELSLHPVSTLSVIHGQQGDWFTLWITLGGGGCAAAKSRRQPTGRRGWTKLAGVSPTQRTQSTC